MSMIIFFLVLCTCCVILQHFALIFFFSDHFDKISNTDKEKLKKYIEDHPNGVTIPELLGVLAISQKNETKWKKSCTANDIITSCSAFSVLIDNKLYKNDITKEEIKSQKEATVAVRKPLKPIVDKKAIEIHLKSNQHVAKAKDESKKKSGKSALLCFYFNFQISNVIL